MGFVEDLTQDLIVEVVWALTLECSPLVLDPIESWPSLSELRQPNPSISTFVFDSAQLRFHRLLISLSLQTSSSFNRSGLHDASANLTTSSPLSALPMTDHDFHLSYRSQLYLANCSTVSV
ncbi:hypothetical protein Rs2_49737 [Raphanus sativus]|nr:hypothetical protein Rs2_51337 [Raphanus sativus]KAJ4868716.1 hypothetical protein Rs2_49737 [Raphanus sativus]